MIVDSKTSPEQNGIFVPGALIDTLTENGCPTYLAVYMYALRQYEAGNKNISNAAIAEALKISLMDVVNALLFFNSRGFLKIHNFTTLDDGDFDIEFCFEAGNEKAPLPFRPSYRASEISRRLQDNPRMSQMYKMASQMLGKTLSSADTELLYSFHDYYALPIEVILVLIEYYVSKGKRSMKTLEKEVGKWASAGIDTIEKAKAYIKKREDFLSYASRVRSILGIHERRLSTRELTMMNAWQNDFAMSFDMVQAAFELTVNQTGKLSFAYMNKILESWSKQGFKTPQDITKKQPAQKPASGKKSRYDFDAMRQRALDTLNQY